MLENRVWNLELGLREVLFLNRMSRSNPHAPDFVGALTVSPML
jgi:hypothetical protein